MRGISIIMPCYNAGVYLEEAVLSVWKQNYGRLAHELIIVDDASNDPVTTEILAKIESSKTPEIRIHRLPENMGQCAARNQALAMAQYDFILPVDADDILNTDLAVVGKKTYFARGIEILESDPDVAFVYALPKYFGAKTYLNRPDPFNEKKALTNGNIPVCGIFRKEDAEAIGGYDMNLRCVEDWAFWIDMLGQRCREGRGRKVIRFTEPYYLYRQHGDGLNVNSRARNYNALFERFVSKNPEIYRLHYPGVADEHLAAHVAEARETFKDSVADKFRAAVLYPNWFVLRLAEKTRGAFGLTALPIPKTEFLHNTLK